MSTKEKTGQELEIRKTIVIDASVEIVFKAITDPQELTNWFPDQAVLEPKVGGKMKFSFYKEKSTDEHAREIDYNPEGTTKEFIPNKKVSYTWQLMGIPDFPETTVTWELEKIEAKKTRLVLTHSGFTGQEGGKLSFTEHDNGWAYFLGRLEKYCKGE